MNINESIEYLMNDLERSTKKLHLYHKLMPVFQGIEFPKGINTWVSTLSDGDVLWIEFSAGYSTEDEKNLQPFIHALCQKFAISFEKTKGHSEDSLEYSASFTWAFGDTATEIRLRVTGVVPKTCRIEETVIELSEEEVEQARREALENVKTSRTIRKIICTDEPEPEKAAE